jgi:hypothetical protein
MGLMCVSKNDYIVYTYTLYHKDNAKNTRYINSPIKDYHIYFRPVFFMLDKNHSKVLFMLEHKLKFKTRNKPLEAHSKTKCKSIRIFTSCDTMD